VGHCLVHTAVKQRGFSAAVLLEHSDALGLRAGRSGGSETSTRARASSPMRDQQSLQDLLCAPVSQMC
jgi:hypothetical protein